VLLVLSFAKNRALDRAFGALLRAMLSFVEASCSRSCFLMLSSWTKSWFLVLSLVPKIVFFGAPRAKNHGLDRAFWCSPSCQKSCFLVLSFVPEIVLFGAFPRAKNCALDRAFWCSPLPKIVLWIVLAVTAIRLVLKQRYLQCCILMITS